MGARQGGVENTSEGLDSDDDSGDSGIEIPIEVHNTTPALSREQLENARAIIRNAFANRHHSQAQEDDDDVGNLTNETIVLPPELQKAAAKAARARASSATPFDAADTVKISVTWTPHPKDPSGKHETFDFEVERHKPLRDVFESVADEMDILSSKLYMTHRGVRIFGSVTANYLKVGTTASLVACDKATYEYMREQEEIQRRSSVHPPSDHEQEDEDDDEDIVIIPDDDDDNGAYTSAHTSPRRHPSTSRPTSTSRPATSPTNTPRPPSTTPAAHGPSAPSDDEDDTKFKIILRCASLPGKDVTLTVRPTTTCGAIVRAFVKKVGLAEQFPNAGTAQAPPPPPPAPKGRGRKAAAQPVPTVKDPQLMIEGDKMGHGVKLEDTELEDGDVVDVVGL
ncbi:hypothetical protein BD626DRAFT_629882 [Schizophyllum amplum]|uniref:Rad60/SUMO-like domain-containing protein n=1 Tax=Schizophyllum amplum TaxID=97359 RepID=A0A550CH75_9AGAR|nr:hypothetical protein BD626DRAFT_629882 [Auriculariopsis ampla]